MFGQLTKYLFLYREMNVPAVGAFKLVEVPASFDAINKLIHPPVYDIQFSEQSVVKEHQLSFLATTLHCDQEKALLELERFGDQLKEQLHNGTFLWKGLGSLVLSEGAVHFDAAPQIAQLLQPVPAERVHRERTPLPIETTKEDTQIINEELAEVESKKRSPLMIIVWILIGLSLVFIGFHFYKHGLKPSSSGNQMKIQIEKSK